MISYHIVASVALAQREDLVRQAERLRTVQEGRAVRRRVLKAARSRVTHGTSRLASAFASKRLSSCAPR